ncbi:MAG TPA: hypothetical protein VFU40_09815, partial [Gemmatimonadales bacterium]|nr:hypothetical protein [Gemmatimonadales bacterium]
MRWKFFLWVLSGGLAFILGCDSTSISGPERPGGERRIPELAVTLSSYFPPPEASGGWRKTKDSTRIKSLGMRPDGLAAFGAYTMSLPWVGYYTGVSGYKASNKASLVIKNGWIVGEYYNQSSARTGVYYLASNGKTFGIMLFGRMLRDYPELGISLSS